MMFLMPLTISELATSKNFFLSVWTPGGAVIILPKIGILQRKKKCLGSIFENNDFYNLVDALSLLKNS